MGEPGGDASRNSWEYILPKYHLLLATLVATVTYGTAFNSPGGVWQDADPFRGRIAGDPIIRETRYRRYLVYFYSNATAFACSLMVIALIVILSVLRGRSCIVVGRVLTILMVQNLLSPLAAYAAGTFLDRLTAVYSLLPLAGVVAYLVARLVLGSQRSCSLLVSRSNNSAVARLRKELMLLATFAVNVTYVAGLSAPGGFWDHGEGGHNPGDAILKDGPHDKRLKAFVVCNTMAFGTSLLILVMLLESKLRFTGKVRSLELYGLIGCILLGLVGAYAAGSSREIGTTIYVAALVGAVVVFILVQVLIVAFYKDAIKDTCLCKHLKGIFVSVFGWCLSSLGQQTHSSSSDDEVEQQQNQALEKARSHVLLLATFAAAITYQAGLSPPGGLWQGNDDGGRYKAGDPILLTANPRRYKAFYYCNSISFVASLVTIVLVRMKTLHHHNALEVVIILDLLGLIGTYAAGSCRDVRSSVCAMAMAGAVLVYIVIHHILIDREDGITRSYDHQASLEKKAAQLEKRRKRLLLFAILAATITYQAGLTPPSGFLLEDDQATGRVADDPVLLNNYPRRYTAFFYCNSVSFMVSIVLTILLVNPNLYRPAIRGKALYVCTAASMLGIIGAYAAGCTQHLKTSVYTFTLGVYFLFVCIAAVTFLALYVKRQKDDRANKGDQSLPEAGNRTEESSAPMTAVNDAGEGSHLVHDMEANAELRPEDDAEEPSAMENPKTGQEVEREKLLAKRKYLMLLGILAASITYQAGLTPPGGVWQDNSGGHAAGDPVMYDNRRHQYLAFFYSNSTSFVASVVVIILMLPPSLNKKWWLGVMNTTIVLDLLGLLIAYAAGSSQSWKTAGYVTAFVIAVLAYFVIHVVLSCFVRRGQDHSRHSAQAPQNQVANGPAP
ncbi:unnamed protein product [Urochloa humidicola]